MRAAFSVSLCGSDSSKRDKEDENRTDLMGNWEGVLLYLGCERWSACSPWVM